MSDVEVVYVNRLDVAEAFIIARAGGVVKKPGVEIFGYVHRFTPGMYVREITMPAGSVLTSKVHRTEHPFVVSKGRVWVHSDIDGPQLIEAPYCGITKPGTRRLLVVEEETVWTTFHATTLTDIDEIEREIIEPYTNPMLVAHGPNVRIEQVAA